MKTHFRDNSLLMNPKYACNVHMHWILVSQHKTSQCNSAACKKRECFWQRQIPEWTMAAVT